MAVTSGTVTSGTLKHSYFYVSWQQVSQNIGSNYTTINWQVGLNCGTSSSWDAWYSNAIKVNDLTINGSSVLSNATYSNISGAGNHQLASGSVNISHNNDGTKSFTITISGWLYSYGNTSGTKTFTLPVIARTSTVEVTSFTIGSPTTITITRQSSSFTHTLTWSCGSKSGTIKTKTTATSINYTMPSDDLYSQLAGAVSKAGTITCKTYSGDTLVGTSTCSFTATAKESSVSCNSFNIGDATTITISRESNVLKHTLTWSFGNSQDNNIVTKTPATSYGTTIPAASLYAQIPNATSGTGTITCKTYSGDNLVGTSTCTFTAYAKQSDCTPSVLAEVRDVNSTTIALTGSNRRFVKGFSDASVIMSATPKNSATISSYEATVEGVTKTTRSSTFNGITNKNVTVKATDSRGYFDKKNITLLWVDYVKLAFTTISVKRTESTASTATMTLRGNYFNDSFGSTNNSLTVRYRYKQEGGSYGSWTTITPTITNNTFNKTVSLSNLDPENEYLFQFEIADQLMTVTQTFQLSQGIPILRLGKNYAQIGGILKFPANGNFEAITKARVVEGNTYVARVGVGNNKSARMDLLLNNELIAAVEARYDGKVYNYFTGKRLVEENDNMLIYRGTLANNTDVDDVKTAGIYWASNMTLTNLPVTTYEWGTIVVIVAGNLVQQFFIKPSQSFFYMREFSGNPGSWGNWKQITVS